MIIFKVLATLLVVLFVPVCLTADYWRSSYTTSATHDIVTAVILYGYILILLAALVALIWGV